MKNSRSSGVGRGQFLYTANWRTVRGFPSRRHAAIWAWNAASKGGRSCWNSSRGQAGEIQELCGARLHIGKPYTGHGWCLLAWETQFTINRDKLKGGAPAESLSSDVAWALPPCWDRPDTIIPENGTSAPCMGSCLSDHVI